MKAKSMVSNALYGVIAGLGFSLIMDVGPRFEGEYVELTITLVGAAGIIVGARGLFFWKKTSE
jgi:hypothetical protein